jgi:hypothetical protein
MPTPRRRYGLRAAFIGERRTISCSHIAQGDGCAVLFRSFAEPPTQAQAFAVFAAEGWPVMGPIAVWKVPLPQIISHRITGP